MARPLRIEYPGAVYHVTGQGNEGKLAPRRAKAQARYRACARAGRQVGSLWRDRRAQRLRGEAPFADRLSAQIRGQARSAAMPTRPRCAARPRGMPAAR